MNNDVKALTWITYSRPYFEFVEFIDEAQNNIALQKNKMLDEMHGEIVDVALSAAEKILQSKLDSKNDKESIDEFIKEVTNK